MFFKIKLYRSINLCTFFCLLFVNKVQGLSFTVGTCNLWNIMFNWKTRAEHIANLIIANEIDVIAFQEVRITKTAYSTLSQLAVFKKHLPDYKWSLARSSGLVTNPKEAYWNAWTEEGIGILSRKQIISSSVVNLTKTGGVDTNTRIGLHAKIRLGLDEKDIFNMIVVHFSYDKEQQCQNAEDIIKYISRLQLTNVIVLGDLNVYPNFPGPVDLFTSKRQSTCFLKNPGRSAQHYGTLKDAWLTSGDNQEQGLTFSNMPEPGLVSRPDRILISRNINTSFTKTTGDGVMYKKHFYSSVIFSRSKQFIATLTDAFFGWKGYPCPHDCGPHGSCRCGVCVTGGNQINCNIPDCSECYPYKFVLFVSIVIPLAVSVFTLFYSIIKILVVSSRFNQQEIMDILGYRCCLFNKQLFMIPRKYKMKINRFFWLCQLPPFILMIVMLLATCILLALFYYLFTDSIDLIYSILPEEMFPSDHLIVYTLLEV